ncbi:MAG TPA: phosphoenolpyruvate--protein phosphotransferase, partial [Mycolicibacterium fallax]|nr:phosphoenolpyruvate--protein phosphotransferase [Mycolicibacterium fallax]
MNIVTPPISLAGVPVVSGVRYAPVIRPGRAPQPDLAGLAELAAADREAEAARFDAAAAAVARRLRDRAAA